MIHTNRIVTVGEQECIIDRPIVLYRGDREVEIEFTLVGNEFMFSEDGNVIKSVNASHGQLVLNTPSGEHMFSELAECHEGKVVFVVTKEMIDEFIEMGFYSFQIRLYDSVEMKSRVTIPPVMNGFDIRNPIAAEDETNVVDQGIVDYARIFKDQSNEELPTFTWDGEYVKTEWAHHDVITENKMNKIEDALYSINANIKESDVVMLNALDNVKKDADAYVKEHMAEVEAEVDEFERNLNTGVEQFKIDTNAAMTAHKNEVSEVVDGFSGEIESINSQLAHIENLTNVFNVKDFICDDGEYVQGDNNHDDTTGIQKAINEASKVRGVVYFPAGGYIITDSLLLEDRITIRGDSMQSTVINNQYVKLDKAQLLVASTKEQLYKFTLENITLRGGQVGLQCDSLGGLNGCVFRNVGFELQELYGIKVYGYVQVNIFNNVAFYEVATPLSFGTEGVINHNMFSNCNFLLYKETCLDFNSIGEVNTFIGCRFEGGGDVDRINILFKRMQNVKFIGCYFENIHKTLIKEIGSRDSIMFENCHFTYPSDNVGGTEPQFEFISDGVITFKNNSFYRNVKLNEKPLLMGVNTGLKNNKNVNYFLNTSLNSNKISFMPILNPSTREIELFNIKSTDIVSPLPTNIQTLYCKLSIYFSQSTNGFFKYKYIEYNIMFRKMGQSTIKMHILNEYVKTEGIEDLFELKIEDSSTSPTYGIVKLAYTKNNTYDTSIIDFNIETISGGNTLEDLYISVL